MNGGFGPAATLARAIVRRTVWDSDAADALANLDAVYRERLRARGRMAAEAWYLGQALTFGPRLWLDPRGRRKADGPRDRSMLAAWLDEVRADVRFALRGFRRAPTFALATVSTLTLGIAATTVIYAVVRAVVLRPPPFPSPDRLVWVWPGLGLVGAIGFSRLLGSLLYEVQPIDPRVFASAAAVLGVVALAAALLPARRASRVDPLMAIRGE